MNNLNKQLKIVLEHLWWGRYEHAYRILKKIIEDMEKE